MSQFDSELIQTIASYCDLAVCGRMPFVSKKYCEAVESMTEMPYLKIKSIYDISQCNQIRQSFKVFENAKSAYLYNDFLTQFDEVGRCDVMFLEQFEKMEKIHMIGLPESFDSIYTLQEQICEITTDLCYYDSLDLSEYSNVRKLTLNFDNEAFDFRSVFFNLFEPLDVLRIRNFGDLKMLAGIIGNGRMARKIYVYVDPEYASDDGMEKLLQLKNCQVVLENAIPSQDEQNVIEEDDYFNDEFIYNEQSESDEEVFDMFSYRQEQHSSQEFSYSGSESFETEIPLEKYGDVQSINDLDSDEMAFLCNQTSPKYWPAKVSIDCW